MGDVSDLLKLTSEPTKELIEESVAADQKLVKEFQLPRQKVHRKVFEDVFTKLQR